MNKENRSDWVPENAGKEFASHIRKGVHNSQDNQLKQDYKKSKRLREYTVEEYVSGILEGNRTILGKAITLIESSAPHHFDLAQKVLDKLLPHTGNSIRVGITGVPGVGKSTFIEALGLRLCDEGHHVAVLAIDPSSSLTKGSILGDKTRMENLARHPNAYIRPSPSGGTLGGVANKTRETILTCEAFGFDTVLVETVGVGQSEITVRSLVDYFMLLLLPRAGDELQGIKKGIVEISDGLIVNKADGDYINSANLACSQYSNVLHYFTPVTDGWIPKAMTCSALNDESIEDVWMDVLELVKTTKHSGVFESRRREQSIHWMHTLVNDHLHSMFYQHTDVRNELQKAESAVLDGKLSPAHAAKRLLEAFSKK